MKHVCIIIFAIFLNCCSEKNQNNHITFKNKDLSKIPLQSIKIDFNEFMDPRVIDRKGNLLFVMESNRTSADIPAIHIIDAENWTYYRKKGVKGNGPLELAGANSFFAQNASDSFWVYSSQDKKMLEYSINDTSMLAINEYRQPEIIFKVIRISQATDTTFLGVSADDPNRIIEFNTNGERIAGYGEWEKVETHPELDNFELFQFHDGWFKGSKEYGLHVFAGIFRDRLEIFNYPSKEFIIVDGPSLDLPSFKIMGEGMDSRLYIPLEDNTYKYRDISITQDYIFALYGGIGEFEIRKTNKVAEKIYVFTHKGEPVCILELDRSISCLTVNTAKNKIYGVTTDADPGIAVFDLTNKLP